MNSTTEFPKQMVHPAYVRGTTKIIEGSEVRRPDGSIKFADYQGTPDRYPPVAVNTPDEEEQYRAKGYKAYGEADMNAIGFIEYPKMMTHPQHEPAVEAVLEMRNGGGQLLSAGSPGRPERFPARVVNNPREEEAAAAAGYQLPGKSDPEAMASAKASPYVAGRVTSEYPKMVAGQLVQDPNVDRSAVQEYPKWVGEKLVNSRAEEDALLGPRAEPAAAELAQANLEALRKQKADADAALAAAEAAAAGAATQPAAPVTAPPAVVQQENQDQPTTGDDRAKVMAELESRGIPFNKYWKIDKLKAALKHADAA